VGPHRLLEELLGVAAKLGLEVRIQPFHGGQRSTGGLCRLRGRSIVILDQRAGAFDKGRALADALAEFDIEEVYLAPEARALVARARARRS
jgi:hypothetical protein